VVPSAQPIHKADAELKERARRGVASAPSRTASFALSFLSCFHGVLSHPFRGGCDIEFSPDIIACSGSQGSRRSSQWSIAVARAAVLGFDAHGARVSAACAALVVGEHARVERLEALRGERPGARRTAFYRAGGSVQGCCSGRGVAVRLERWSCRAQADRMFLVGSRRRSDRHTLSPRNDYARLRHNL